MRGNEQARPEEAALLISESPRHIRRLRPAPPEINAVRQKDVIPWLGRRRLRLRLVNLNSNLASSNMNVVQLPAPQKNPERVEARGDSPRLKRSQGFAAILRLKVIA